MITVDASMGPVQVEALAPNVVSAHDPPDWLLEDGVRRVGIPVVETLHGVPTPLGTRWEHESVRSLGVRRFVAVSELVRLQYLAGNPWVSPTDVVTIPNPLGEPRHVVTDRDTAHRVARARGRVPLRVARPSRAAEERVRAHGRVRRCSRSRTDRATSSSPVASTIAPTAQQLVRRRQRELALSHVHPA